MKNAVPVLSALKTTIGRVPVHFRLTLFVVENDA